MKLQSVISLIAVTIATLQVPAYASNQVDSDRLAELQKSAVVVCVVDPGARVVSQGSGWEEASGWTNESKPFIAVPVARTQMTAAKTQVAQIEAQAAAVKASL